MTCTSLVKLFTWHHCNLAEKCDLFTGDWVPNEAGPIYTNSSCPLIESHQNCMRNGRPDTGYLYWRWNPRDCDLPKFDPARFLEMMRNKVWALVGDSISRNHVQSLLCMLSMVRVWIICRIWSLDDWVVSQASPFFPPYFRTLVICIPCLHCFFYDFVSQDIGGFAQCCVNDYLPLCIDI